MLIRVGRSRYSRGRLLAVETTPELPRVFIDTTFSMPAGRVWNCVTTSDLVNALANAIGGDIIVLANGNVFQGPFNLRARSDTQFIYIVDSRIFNGTFPRTPGDAVSNQVLRPLQRARPSDFASTTSIIQANSANVAITTDPGAAYYRFAGIEFSGALSPTGPGVALIDIRDQTASVGTLSAQPHHIYVDRCYPHGHAGIDCLRGSVMNGQYIAFIDSWLEEFHGVGDETQALVSWNGAGPFKIVSNYLSAATENILFGGADPEVANLIPSDIEFRLNHLFKDDAWLNAGLAIKNHYEHKNGQRALVEQSVFENCWGDAQTGNSILLQVLSNNASAPWTTIGDITMRQILIKGVEAGMVLAARIEAGGLLPTTPLHRCSFTNMLFQDVGLRNNGTERLIQLSGDFQYLTFDHLTGAAPNIAIDMAADSLGPPTGLVIKRSIFGHGQFGIFGDTVAEGKVALDTYGGDYEYAENVLYGSAGSFLTTPYNGLPASNSYPQSAAAVGFVDPSTDQWGLQSSSPYHLAGSDGLDLGCDVAGLNAAIANVVQSR